MVAAAANDILYFTQLLKAKSRGAFADLYDRYSAALFGFICKMVKNKNIAEELLQEAFIKAWKNIDAYDASKESLFTWLLRIANNTCVNYTKTTNRETLKQ
jgi:RNA polymerase sigma factor (sigma-70 family)